ncbi:MAG: leucine--tRNA ligase, partial [Clostridia bacterium]|nr:leucine--tRNA ligase [Clostridia bacterium]
MKSYDFKAVEQKWQKIWEETRPFRAVDFHPTKPKFYVLYEFYNISGNLHMGHLKGTVPADALARYKRLKGYNVLFPIGGDAFGLPAENAAIKKGINPHDFVRDGMKRVLDQSKALGLSFDYDRTICTSDPEYYKWTQWIFLQLLKNDKAYKKQGFVNFCPNCKTVLSNEDSQGGKCDRCGGDVLQEERWVWFLKMKEYSEKLLGNVDRIQMADNLKDAQRNWIGKSEGMQVAFDLFDDSGEKLGNIEIFTTCIETVYGITFVVMAPEHELVDKLKSYIKNFDEVEEYRKKVALRSEFDRMSNLKEKTGCALKGLYVVNPVNGAKVPLYLADFVLAGYGTGAVMAVPTHDQRDFEFAKEFGIPMIQVIEGDVSKCAVEKKEYLAKNSKLMNSAEFSGMTVKEAKVKIADKIEAMGVGKRQTNYKMTDWPFNRQRYWGEPFPVVFCDKCGAVGLDEKDLPLVLPETEDYLPNANGDSPISKIETFVKCKCPKCGGDARRETDTMPNWAGSSWYWLRYMDPHNDKALVDFEKAKYWGSVDVYTGGTEHITRHVLYAFFWQNFLYEIGAVPTRDPFIRKMGSGLILDDQGKKMSKSSTNGVSPLEVIDKYGADAARLHLHFLGGYEDNTPWTYDGITGITSFLDKVWNLQEIVKGDEVSKEHIVELNKLIKKVGEDLEDLKLNTIISSLMIFLKKVRDDGFITKEEYRQFLILLNPLAPHITSEIYETVFGASILDAKWPEYNEKFLVEDEVKLPIQINGKLSKVIS